MKKTVYSILSSSFKKKKQWNYYNRQYDFGESLPFLSVQNSKEFLKKFIKVAGKARPELNSEIDKIGNRATHTVSTFFLGHFLYRNTILKERIDEEIDRFKIDHEINENIEFSYFWFLTCLFHDLGYGIEENKSIVYCNITDLENEKAKLTDIYGVPDHYKDIVENYFNYRLKYHCKNDHGIIAGYFLYHDLCEIRRFSEDPAKVNNDKTQSEKCQEEFIELSWPKELVDAYSFCAWNILAHNMWYVSADNLCFARQYEDEGLSNLILEKKENEIQYKISSEENPFFFLFCVVDSIEPFKRVLNIKHLKKVSIEISNDKSKILISTKLECGCNDAIIKQADSLNNWLTKATKVGNTVSIEL